MLRFIAKGAG